MRLTLINQFYAPDISPTAHLCASLAEHRAALGDDVTVLTGRGGYLGAGAPPGSAAACGAGAVEVVRLWTAQLGSRNLGGRFLDWITFYVGAVFRAAMLPRQDVIVCLTTPPYIALAGVIHKLLHPRVKLVLWNMDCYPEALEMTGMIRAGGVVSEIMRAMNRAIFRRVDHLVCLDGAMKHLLAQYAPREQPLSCDVIPNWEKADLFAGAAPQWDDAPAAALVGKFVILYLGNAGYGHEMATMLEAAGRLAAEPVVFLLVGGGALRPWMARQVSRRGLNNVVLRDYVPKELTPAVMRRADCALITLENNAAGVMSPSKLHANLAMGLPVIYVGPQESNVDEAIARFGCGVSLRPGDAAELERWIRNLMRDPARRAVLRNSARLAFEQAYCDQRALPAFDAVLDGVARREDR